MKLAQAISIFAGGPGSGCNPDKGKCGRHKSGSATTGRIKISRADLKEVVKDWSSGEYDFEEDKERYPTYSHDDFIRAALMLPQNAHHKDGLVVPKVLEGPTADTTYLVAALNKLYSQTQKELSGGRDVVLYHGTLTWQGNHAPLESWTSDRSVAENFGNLILTAHVPVSAIIAHPRTAGMNSEEQEYLLLGGMLSKVKMDVETMPMRPGFEGRK